MKSEGNDNLIFMNKECEVKYLLSVMKSNNTMMTATVRAEYLIVGSKYKRL